jgi:hypothetical protein
MRRHRLANIHRHTGLHLRKNRPLSLSRSLRRSPAYHADEHAQTSVPNRATVTPLGSPGPRRQYAGSLEVDAAICRQNPSCRGRGAARTVSAAVRRASIRDTSAASGPEPGTWKDPDPRRRSSRGSGGQDRPAWPAMAATRRLRPVPSQRLPGAMISGAPAILQPAGHIDPDPHGQTRPGYRSSRSRTAINAHIVFGSNNFRSPILCGGRSRGAGSRSCADHALRADY